MVADMIDRAATVQAAAQFLEDGQVAEARTIMQVQYPFRPKAKLADAVRETGLPVPTLPVSAAKKIDAQKRRRRILPAEEWYRALARDQFRCAYSGIRLIIPPSLVLFSVLLPEEFPCTSYPNCPLATTHIGMWLLYPSLDHVEAFASGGECSEANLVTASSAVNMVKSRSSLSDLGWPKPHAFGNPDNWDGLAGWFLHQIERDPSLLIHPEYGPLFRSWSSAVHSDHLQPRTRKPNTESL